MWSDVVETLTASMYACSVQKQHDQFNVRKSMHHHTIQINQPTRCNNLTSLLLDVYVWFNMFREPLCPSSGAYNCTRDLWFYRCGGWSLVGRGLADHDQQPPNVGRRGARNMSSHT